MKEKITLQNCENITLNEAFLKFVKRKRALNLAEETIEFYDYSFKRFTDFINGKTFCKEITDDTIIDYINFLKEGNPDLTDVTVNTYVRGLRAILYYFMEKEYLKPFKIHLGKAEKKIKPTYTDNELERLLKRPNTKKCTFPEYRNWVIINYLLATGNRLATVVNLKVGDLDFDSHEIKLKKVKNKKQYNIPMSTELERILTEYIEHRGGNPDDYLFCTHHGEMLSKEGLKTAIEKYNSKRGVEKNSIHLFRHTFAKNWILNGGDSFRLQQILGHSSQDIVKEYVNMYGDELHRDFDNFNPLDNLKKNAKNTQNVLRMKK